MTALTSNQTVDNSDIGDPTESKTETIDDNMHDQTDNMDNEDQDNSEITQTDNNTLDFNSPIDLNDHNSSMKTQAGTDNSHKESEPIESEDESDPRSFEPESIDMTLTLMLTQSVTLMILKPYIWICVRILGQRFLLENQYPYFLLDSLIHNGWIMVNSDFGI